MSETMTSQGDTGDAEQNEQEEPQAYNLTILLPPKLCGNSNSTKVELDNVAVTESVHR